MSALLITYDLNKPGQDYSGFYKVRDSYPYAKLSESSYAISTTETPTEVYKKLEEYIDKSDRVFIIALSNSWFGFGTQEIFDWLNKFL